MHAVRFRVWLGFASLVFFAGHASAEDRARWEAPPLERAVSVRNGRSDEQLTFDRFLDQLAQADVVFVGESHTDETTHRVELAIYEGLLARREGRVTLAMEMFERDVQNVLDEYLNGKLDEATFLQRSRPWENYRSAYRPLIERAKQASAPVVASNFPRPLRMRLRGEGANVFDSLDGEARQQAPGKLLPNTDAYWKRVDNAIRGHAGSMREGDRLSSTQSLWDNSMGEACALALDRYPGHMVLHLNGDFHSQYWDGTVHQLRQRKPQAKMITVSVAPTTNPSTVELVGAPTADFVVLAEARASDLNEGTWSVPTHRDWKYHLSLPSGLQAEHRVPLMIWFVDDGLTGKDGVDLWKSRLGERAALVVVEPSYREQQQDMGIGGRWFWADSFSADIGAAVDATEKIWGYVCRHYPIDPQQICIAGEGSGATVAAAVTLLTERIDANGIGSQPRQYAKLKDFPLPLPEAWGDERPPRRTLQLLAKEADQSWWQEELKSYDSIGLESALVEINPDPWQREPQLERLIRTALGLSTDEVKAASTRKYLLLEHESPRARQWARMQALWYAEKNSTQVAVLDAAPEDASISAISTEIVPTSFAAPDALPRCPGPFGGTTVIVLPPDVSEQQLRDWLTLVENDPLTKQSRFHRLRVATTPQESSPAGATSELMTQHQFPAVLEKLHSENRKNILIVPGQFFGDSSWIRSLKRSVRSLEDQMTLQWLPGLGGSKAAVAESVIDPTIEPPVHHDLTVKMDPQNHQLEVLDKIQLSPSLRQARVTFALNKSLTILHSDPPVAEAPENGDKGIKSYVLTRPANEGTLTLTYSGKMDFGLSDQKEEYTRGFRETRGALRPEGIYLDSDSAWVAKFDERLIRFNVNVELPDNWHVISQGKGASRDGSGWARWSSDAPMDQVYLVGGPLFRETDAAGGVEVQVFLREKDESLSRKYLDNGARYIEMYRNLIGPYPYSKFCVVENFWETGYGMPSFTLLGPQVIRFPFILHSSFPHEILHNWWGNSVFVDYEQGNWCEGLTAYMADHLIQEQRGSGAEYRRNSLQRYRDYVREGRDFPLNEFRNRHNAATEAVGYGKSLMMFHMLRNELGDESFRAGLAAFYRKYREQRASFDDIRKSMEGSREQLDLTAFFRQWVTRPGAPQLAVQDVAVVQDGAEFVISGRLKQLQAGEPFHLRVPYAVRTESGIVAGHLQVQSPDHSWEIRVPDLPDLLSIDPQFDLFRLLDPHETPSTIGQIFGQAHILAVLPSASADDGMVDGYRELIEAWRSDEHSIDITTDTELQSLPKGTAIWLFGRTNRWALQLAGNDSTWAVDEKEATVNLGGERVAFAGRSIVAIRRHPEQLEHAVGWIVVDSRPAIPGLGRKLPHYGKYSYLAFEGDEPTNTVKGQWDTTGSPLVVDLRKQPGNSSIALKLEARKALAELPPVFSSRALAAHVEWLAAPEREGRGLGSPGLAQSADYIAKAMASAGLLPGGDDGTWFQKFTVPKGPNESPVDTVNVVGVLPGKRLDWKDQSIVLSAHYDHLGHGWPDVRSGNEGKIHPGADDNASGVAVILELARIVAAEGGGARNLVVIAFSAEESGRLGSRHYVQHPTFPIEELRGVINLDAVGRLESQPLSILGTGTADEWQHVFRGCSFVTGIPSKNIPEAAEASDQLSFIERGVPAVQIFSGLHGDYHRPSDTADKVLPAGLVKVASFVKESINYMLDREPPLTVRIAAHGDATAGSPPTANNSSTSTRKVLFGAVPAFDFQGPGVKLESVVADSPAAQAGIQPGDVLVRLDQVNVADLQTFSNLLKKMVPDQKVTAVVIRDGKEISIKVTVRVR